MKTLVAALTFIFIFAPAIPQYTYANEKSDAASSYAESNNKFAIDLYHQLAKGKDENLFFSPYSISAALTMVWAGARGQTEQEMADVLYYDVGDKLRPHEEIKEVTGALTADADDDSFAIYVGNDL